MKKIQILSTLLFIGLSLTAYQLAIAQPGITKLFDGKTLNGWKQLGGKANFTVENGVICGTTVYGTANSFLATTKEYGDFILELDVMMEDAKGNSGIQTRSHYDAKGNNGNGKVYGRQVEIDPSARNWTGGIYDEARRKWLYPMDLNPNGEKSFKTGVYNHIKIECIGDETKTWINGIASADVVDTIDKKGFIALQVHAVNSEDMAGKKVCFKNINIQTTNLKPKAFPSGIYVVNLKPNQLTAYEQKEGWHLLFDGKNTDQWRSANGTTFPEKGWIVNDGIITVKHSDGAESENGGDVVTKKEFSAFDFSFDFKYEEGANSGVKYFVTLDEKTKGSAIGLEYQILDDAVHPDAKLGRDGNRTLSSLYDLIKADKSPASIHPTAEWNTGRIVVHPDNRVEHYLNGVKVLEYLRGSKAFENLVAISKYKNWEKFGEASQGHLLLQDHGAKVDFKNLKIKNL